MKRSIYRYIKDKSGVAAIEFALIGPMILLILIGAFDYGNYINQVMQLENVTRTAAEYVVEGGDIDNIQTDVISLSNLSDLNTNPVTVTAQLACACRDETVVADCTDADACGANDYTRQFIEVTLSRTYTPIMPYPGLPDSVTLGGSVRMQLQ
jgi:Flp pilus assembly protein TadG